MANPNMLFNLNLKDVEIHEALHTFFETAGRAYVLDDEVTGVVSLHVADVGFHDALVMMLPTDYEALEIGDIYHIHHVTRPSEQLKY